MGKHMGPLAFVGNLQPKGGQMTKIINTVSSLQFCRIQCLVSESLNIMLNILLVVWYESYHPEYILCTHLKSNTSHNSKISWN